MKSETKSHDIHILPLKLYLGIGIALIILTVITYTVAQIDLGPYNLVVAMLIAMTKALLVALFFMHLLYDNKLYMIIFSIGLIFIAIFIIFTMFDTMRRGDIYLEVGEPINKEAIIYQQMQTDTNDSSHQNEQ
jgi:cytochrome c oxidase subunit 4